MSTVRTHSPVKQAYEQVDSLVACGEFGPGTSKTTRRNTG